jgi:glycosyltransferase involved in cell wall biosynthesis
MRICFLGTAYSTHTYRWIQYFAGKGHEIHLISFEEFSFKPMENLTVHRITPTIQKKENGFRYPAYFINSIINPLRIKKLIRTINPDILHAHYLTDYGLLGYFIRFHPFVITLWGSDILLAPKESNFHRIMAKLILNSSNLVTCDSNIVRNECLTYSNHPEKVEVIQWGVDLSTFREKRNDHTKRNNITILSNREFLPNYNIDSIILSVPYVIEKYPQVKYILKNFLGSQAPELQQLARSLNVTKNIEFVNKIMAYNELPELLYRGDIFISIPSSDGSSMALLEAMACGLAAIVSDIPANHEWITDGWNGFIVPVRNEEKLANAIIQLIEKPELIQLFGKRNAQIIHDRADREKHMAHMENLYQELIEKNK